MKLRNKKTGEIVDMMGTYNECTGVGLAIDHHDGSPTSECYHSLAELNEEWEDYEEPKDEDYWYIEDLGKVNFSSELLDKVAGTPNNILIYKILGNYFETKEEAEKAVEKLKAWKRLKNFGFKFIGKDYRADKNFGSAFFKVGEGKNIRNFYQDNQDFYDDLDLLFGGENE